MFDAVEKLKRQYTDKYVVVDDSRPELKRFKNQTGQVKTINMSGRALVQFDAYNNIGWYDIALDYLKVIDKPLPKPELVADGKSAPTKKPPAAKTSPAEGIMLSARDASAVEASAKTGAPGKPSTADILAAARAKAGAGPKKPAPTEKPAAPAAAAPGAKLSTAEILAAARAKAAAGGATSPAPKAPAPPAKPAAASTDPKKMSTADILAAVRAKKAAEGTPTQPPAEATPTETAAPEIPAPAPAAVQTPVAAPAPKVAAPQASPPAPAAKAGNDRASLPKDTAGIIAWCRRTDAK
jgi:hypothetical protein